MNKSKKCFQCGEPGEEMYGFIICPLCKSKLGLFTDDTIKKHIDIYSKNKEISYHEEIQKRLLFIENDFIKKKIKLLHILERHQVIMKE